MQASINPPTAKIRRHDLDWIRVLVFGLLILFHVGMFFVPWDWHLKNNVLYQPLVYPMAFLSQWRLHSLFLISGMGTSFALAFRDGKTFRKERWTRLGVPLLFGMLVIVMPQVYLERLADGDFEGYWWEFYGVYFHQGAYPEGNFSWHHLWFLPYLLAYSLILSPVLVWLKRNPEARLLQFTRSLLAKPWGLYTFILPLYLFEAFLEPFWPTTHNLVSDWFTFTNFAYYFFIGFLLIQVKEAFWAALDRLKGEALVTGILAFGTFLGIRILLEDHIFVHFTEALVKVINAWSWILVIFGYGAQYLNKPSRLLSYCNEAVYPFYILHQTLTIILAYYLMDLPWGFWPKFLILAIGTFGGCWLLYEGFIRRFAVTRLLFGLKPKQKSKA
ncbi:MAG: acyltransferase family protein [Bacteroidota bacterium]